MGTWTYDFNVFGELASQTSALSQTQTLSYDRAGRLTTRVEPEGTTTFGYWTTGIGRIGKPHTISGPGQSEYYEYDATLGTPTLVRRTLEGTQYNFNMEYDTHGRLTRMIYPVTTSSYRFRAQYVYDSWGHLSEVRDFNANTTLYTLTESDAMGREVHVLLGSGVREYRTFDRATGQLRKIDTGANLLSPTVQRLEFTWDEVGNVTSRQNHLISRTESFQYDSLNRLTQSQVSGQAAVTVGYSAGGRIESKTGVGSYTYNAGSRPYAVTSAGGCSYGYDAGGRMTSRCGQTLEWYSYDLPKKLAAGTQSSEFSYGVHRDRYKQVRKTGSTTNATIWYVGGLFEVEVAGSTTTYRHFIQGRERVFAVLERVSTTNTLRYLHRDHQGSVTEITSASGSVQERLAFDAWGLRRNATTWAALANPFSGTQLTKRGYTGHEHLDTVELIHMNGRVQDPRLGRFISPDPIVQAPYHSQSLNRYSYVWNNPVSLVDPSGFKAEVVDEIIARGQRPEVPHMSPDQIDALLLLALTMMGDTADHWDPLLLVAIGAGHSERNPMIIQTEGGARHGQSTRWSNGVTGDSWIGQRQYLGLTAGQWVEVASWGAIVIDIIVPAPPVLASTMLTARVAGAARAIPDSALVVRGGGAANQTAAKINAAIGPSRTPGVEGFSAQCNGGTCVADLGRFLRNRELGVTTVGDIRRVGGDVIATPGFGHHVTVTGVSGEAVSPLLRIVTNPNPLRGPR
jgi:RHS repeat-associated protein